VRDFFHQQYQSPHPKKSMFFHHLSGVGVLLDFLSSILHAFKRSDQVGMNVEPLNVMKKENPWEFSCREWDFKLPEIWWNILNWDFFSGQWKCGGTYPMKELGCGIFVPWLRMYYSLLAKKKASPSCLAVGKTIFSIPGVIQSELFIA